MYHSTYVSPIQFRTLVSAMILFAFGFGPRAFAHDAAAVPAKYAVEFLDKAPVRFVKNQVGANQAQYFVQGKDKSLLFSRNGVTFELADGCRVNLEFIGCNPAARMIGRDPASTTVSYLKGKPDQWKAGLHTFSTLVYEDLWPGIDLVYRGTLDRLKYEFVVRPGADPSKIRMSYRGASSVSISAQGRLEIATPTAVLRDDAPIAYTRNELGHKVPVKTGYVINGNVVGFSIPAYDRGQTLVIDPAVLVYCGYIGPVTDMRDIAVGPDESVYLIGTVTAAGTTNRDVYVAKVNWSGTSLDFLTYIGGTGSDSGRAIAVDADGNIYITGITASVSSSFPLTVGPDLTFNGASDVFVAKLNPTGTGITYCGYIGGTQTDQPDDIAIDGKGSAYVLGSTNSPETTFPVKVGPSLTYKGGVVDAFIAKVNASGASLDYCGYIGGTGQEDPYAIQVDQSGCAYVAGDTRSTDFPVLVGPDLTCNGGSTDAFVAKISASGDRFLYSGYLGGNMAEIIQSLDVDAAGNLYFAGITWSAQDSFPVSRGPDLTFNGGYSDGFVGKLNASGAAIEWCGYLGGESFDGCSFVHVGPGGLIYLTGNTQSSEATFPVKIGPDLTFNGTSDAFVACLHEEDVTLDWCGYVGGAGSDGSFGAVSGSSLYLAGTTDSTEATLPVKTGPGLTYKVDGTLRNGYVAKLSNAGFTSGGRHWALYR